MFNKVESVAIPYALKVAIYILAHNVVSDKFVIAKVEVFIGSLSIAMYVH